MTKLTKKEQAWVARVQKALDACPSPEKIGFFTIGDNDISLYDLSANDEICEIMSNERCSDFCTAAADLEALFEDRLMFPSPVESTAG